jgi:hypothetical protein
MPKVDDKDFKKGGLFLWLLALAGLLVYGGCHSQKTPASYEMHTATPINKVVVDGFFKNKLKKPCTIELFVVYLQYK